MIAPPGAGKGTQGAMTADVAPHLQACHHSPFGVKMPLLIVSKPQAALRSTLSAKIESTA
jgi:hypothetical protein